MHSFINNYSGGVVNGKSVVVFQYVMKFANQDCNKNVWTAEHTTKVNEMATVDPTFNSVITGTIADCVVKNAIVCETNSKCGGLVCAKGAACGTNNAMCASNECDSGKCNNASIVGYAVAVVAVIAAFVF